MKGKKISAMLLTMLMVCTMLPMSIFAGVTDVDEGNDPGIVITKGYTSQAVLKLVRVTPDGSIMGEINTEKSTYSVDFDSPEGQDILQTLDDNMKAQYEADYTLYDKSEVSSVHYSSPQVLNSEGDVIIVGDVDDLVNAYIENGKVSDTLTINKYEVREIEYKVIANAILFSITQPFTSTNTAKC